MYTYDVSYVLRSHFWGDYSLFSTTKLKRRDQKCPNARMKFWGNVLFPGFLRSHFWGDYSLFSTTKMRHRDQGCPNALYSRFRA